ncbi:MAG: glycoside hydrolase family 16 protein [Akkermansia sp.]
MGSQQSYTKDAVSVSDGNLVITSTYETTENCNYHPGETYWPYTMETMPYSSGSITTKGTYDFTYGRLEVSAKLPDATGAWPAIWLLGSEIKGWPRCGEIDILEHISQSEGTIFSTLHFTNEGLKYQSTGRSIRMNADSLYNEFHVYGMEWTETQIKVFVDDITVAIFDLDALNYAYGENPFNTDQYLIINTAIGGNGTWPESADSADYPVDYTVDYVRYYQYDAEAAAEGNGAMEWTATSDLTQTLSTASSNLREEAGFATGDADMIIHAASDSTGSIIANQGSYTGDIRLDVQKAYISEQGLYAGHQDGTLSGDMIMRFSETATGGLASSDGTSVSAFGAYAGDIDGNLYMEFSAQDLALGSTNASNSSVGSAYQGDISGNATLVFNKGDFQSRIIGGVVEGDESSIGGHVSLYLNGGTFHDDVIGGGLAGQVEGNTLVEIMGGDIQSNVYAGGSGSASVQGTTQLSIIGTAASFGADSILSASNESGTQTSDATLLLKTSESAPDRSHSLNGFSGTLTGGSTSGTKTLVFDRVVADLSQANITDFDNISFKNSSEIILASSLGFDSFTMESSSSVTVQSQQLNDSSFTSYGDANITFNQLHISGTSKLIGSGSSAAYTIEELTGTGNLRIENGTAASSERYEFKNINNFNGKIFSSWASGRSVQLSNITLDAGNSMILDGLFTADTGITQTGTGTLTLVSYTSLNTSGTSSLEATVAGAGRLTKLGSGSLTFNGAVSHVGQLYVNAAR